MTTLATSSASVACAQCARRAAGGGRRGNGEGSITATYGPQRADGSVTVKHDITLRTPGQSARQHKSTTACHAEAVRILNELKAGIAQRGVPAPRGVTVRELVDQYLSTKQIRNRPGTLRNYRELQDLHIAPSRLGGLTLAKLTDHDVQDFINERLATGEAPAAGARDASR